MPICYHLFLLFSFFSLNFLGNAFQPSLFFLKGRYIDVCREDERKPKHKNMRKVLPPSTHIADLVAKKKKHTTIYFASLLDDNDIKHHALRCNSWIYVTPNFIRKRKYLIFSTPSHAHPKEVPYTGLYECALCHVILFIMGHLGQERAMPFSMAAELRRY